METQADTSKKIQTEAWTGGSNYVSADLYFSPSSIHLLHLLLGLTSWGSRFRRALHIEATTIDNLHSLRTKWRVTLHVTLSVAKKKSSTRASANGYCTSSPLNLHLLPYKGVHVHPAARRPWWEASALLPFRGDDVGANPLGRTNAGTELDGNLGQVTFVYGDWNDSEPSFRNVGHHPKWPFFGRGTMLQLGPFES